MKKFTLIAATAAMALSANAQYVTEDAGIQPVLDKGAKTLYAWVLNEKTIDNIKKDGVTVIDQMVNDETRFLYTWPDGTSLLENQTSANPVDVDFQTGGHVALTVGTLGWSGAGFCAVGPGTDFTGIDDDTYFHLAYCAMSNPVKSLALILFDGDAANGNTPAKFAVGTAYDDNGAIYPTLGPAPSDEWQAVDIKLGDLKKVCAGFTIPAIANYAGNYLSFLAGGVAGQNFDMDAIYLYSLSEAGIDQIEMGNAEIMVTGKTINATGAKSMVLYDLAGKTVKSANGSTMGLNGVGAGLYIVKAGNSVAKVLVK